MMRPTSSRDTMVTSREVRLLAKDPGATAAPEP